MLGGCTAINGMIYMRGQAADYDHWRQFGNAGWAWDDVLPYFRRSEGSFRGENTLHGGGGEWKVARQRLRWDILEAFRDAAEEIGIPRRDDFNDGDNEGSGYFEVNQVNGIRWTAAKAFLRPAQRRPNLRVLTGALVTEVAFDGKRANGVRYRVDGAERAATAAGEVILAPGRSTHPNSSSSRASAIRTCSATWHRRASRPHRGWCEPSGSPPDPHGLPRHRRPYAQPACEQVSARPRWPPNTPCSAAATVNGAQPARDILPQRRDRSDGRPRVPHPAALDRQARRPAPPLPCGDRVSLQSPPREQRHQPHPEPRSRRTARDPPQLPEFRARPGCRPRFGAPGAPPCRRRSASPLPPEELLPGPAVTADADLLAAIGDIATTNFHPVGTCRMAQMRPPWSMQTCASRESWASASSMPRSCRRYPRETPPRRS